MRPSRPRSPEHRFVIANEEDFQRWLEMVLEAERKRMRQASAERNAEAAAIFEGASPSRGKAQDN
jgi:PHD/YefM family antitoxin component YafN of YafNO toxin-antitoxin module